MMSAMTTPAPVPRRSHPFGGQEGAADESGFETFQAFDAIGFVDWDLATDQLTWDRGAEERFGVPPGSLNNFDAWASIVHPEDAARIRADVMATTTQRRDRMSYRYRYRATSSSDWRIVEGFALCLYNGAGDLVRMWGVAFDITRHAADQQALAQNEAQLRAILATVPDALLIIDAGGLLRNANSAAERMFGYGAADIEGVDIDTLVPHAAKFLPMLRGGDAHPTMSALGGPRGRRADGSFFPIEINVGQASYGNDRIFTCFVRDITARTENLRRAEQLRRQFLRTARLNVMGTVAAGLAHELNQPLAASANYLAAARLKLANQAAGSSAPIDQDAGADSNPDDLTLLDQAAEQIALAGEIIRRLRGFLASGEQHLERLSIPRLIDDAVALALVGQGHIQVTSQLSSGANAMPEVIADRVQALQVLVNLLRNAAEAMNGVDDPKVVIDIAPEAGMTRISVIDNGSGFDPSILRRSDNLYLSTKGAEGMGVGLMISRRLVEGWGGTLSVAEGRRSGACVSFTMTTAVDDGDDVAAD